MNNGDISLPLPSPGLDPTRHLPGTSIAIGSQEWALQRLIARTVPREELPSLIGKIFSGRETDVVDLLRESDAQAFVDVMDEVCTTTLFIFKGWPIYPPLPTFLCSGIERTRSRITYPKEMRESVIQDVCSKYSVS